MAFSPLLRAVADGDYSPTQTLAVDTKKDQFPRNPKAFIYKTHFLSESNGLRFMDYNYIWAFVNLGPHWLITALISPFFFNYIIKTKVLLFLILKYSLFYS